VVSDEKSARELAEFRRDKHQEQRVALQQATKLENMFANMAEGEKRVLKMVLKADVRGSLEAIQHALAEMGNEEVAVNVLGSAPTEWDPSTRMKLGYMPQEFSLYPTLTVEENLRFMAGLYGLGWRARGRRSREMLQYLDLWDARKRLSRDISGGMKRRLMLAAAMMHSPPLLVVDEPAAGLDPNLRARIWELLASIRDDGTTIIRGSVVDQAALHGLLQRLRDIGIPLISLAPAEDVDPERPGRTHERD